MTGREAGITFGRAAEEWLVLVEETKNMQHT